MDLQEIEERLKGFLNRINGIMEMYEKNPILDREWIVVEHSMLKKDLNTERDKFQTIRGQREASEDERIFYFYAVNDAWIELKGVKAGSPPSAKMMGCLYAARLVISHHLVKLA